MQRAHDERSGGQKLAQGWMGSRTMLGANDGSILINRALQSISCVGGFAELAKHLDATRVIDPVMALHVLP